MKLKQLPDSWNKSRTWLSEHMKTKDGKKGHVPYICLSAAMCMTLMLTTLYTPCYAVYVDGKEVGVVASQSTVEKAVEQVESTGSEMLGCDYQVADQINYKLSVALRKDLAKEDKIENCFYVELGNVSNELRRYELLVGDTSVGCVNSRNELNALLDELKAKYTNENTVECKFAEDTKIQSVYSDENLLTIDQMRERLAENAAGSSTYTTQKGDSYYTIARANGMTLDELKALNPNVDFSKLLVGDVLNIKEQTPLLNVETVDNVTYTEVIPSPVEEVNDSSMYKGESKILVQGTDGQTQSTATITRVNGVETGREVLSTVTVKEATTTTKAVGTKEKPKTASTGSFQWPIKGRINSYFGGRHIFGRSNFHRGIDIQAKTGAAIYAADGGTVTFAGWKGSYGKLVVITHDNGIRTYYGHNSSLLVSAGQKVYKGQQIAKAGSTGRSTGPHCHFEVQVNGNPVNPMHYLR